MSEVKIKELDKSLIHRANSNSMSGKRGDISAHEYEVYCQKVMSWNIPDSRKQKIVDQIYTRWSEQLRMASNQGAEIAWLVMAATCHETFGYGRDRLARLKQNSMNNYKQYLEWEKEDKDLALDRLRRCVQDALKEDLRVTDTDDRKGMLSTPGRGPSVYETAAVYSEIFRRARAGRAVAPLAVYSAAKYDETMTAARKRASVMLGL